MNNEWMVAGKRSPRNLGLGYANNEEQNAETGDRESEF